MKNAKQNVPNQHQMRYLKERLTAAIRAHRSEIHDLGRVPDPAPVRAARALLKDYDNRVYKAQRALQQKARNAMERESSKVLRTLLFGTPQEALAAVERFEKRQS